jgi:hypothetical protein
MAMETSLACSSAAAAVALFAASFFSLYALPRVSVYRRSTSAAHAVFVIPGGLSLGARGFLAYGAPSSAAWCWKRRGGAATVGDFGGENRYMRCILEGNEINGGELPFLSPTPRAARRFARFCFVWSPRARLEKPGMI